MTGKEVIDGKVMGGIMSATGCGLAQRRYGLVARRRIERMQHLASVGQRLCVEGWRSLAECL